jgi:hypothetical protein
MYYFPHKWASLSDSTASDSNARDKNWSRGTWYVWKRIRGRVIHKALPEAVTKDDAEAAEREIVTVHSAGGTAVIDDTLFADFATNDISELRRQKNVNVVAKELYVRILIDISERRRCRHHAADAPRCAVETPAAKE